MRDQIAKAMMLVRRLRPHNRRPALTSLRMPSPIALFVFATCRSTEPKPANLCTGPLTVAVSADAPPVIRWAPACGVNRLLVLGPDTPVNSVATSWQISSATGSFMPPVSYGSVPDGAVADVPAQTLQSGRSYEVIVYRAGAEIILATGTASVKP